MVDGFAEYVADYGAGTCLLYTSTAKAVHHFHSFIRRELDEGGSVRDLAEIIWKENPDLIIVTDEVGYGIVPMRCV